MGQWIQVVVSEERKTQGILSMYEETEQNRRQLLVQTVAYIGKNGLGKECEGDGKTPMGIYRFLFAFGTMPMPQTSYPYMHVDESHYWVDDANSMWYNQLVSLRRVKRDWKGGEHMIEQQPAYHYGLALDYNKECVPGKGSAVFLHCLPTEGAGCIAVPEEAMLEILQKIRPGCRMVIQEEENNVPIFIGVDLPGIC